MNIHKLHPERSQPDTGALAVGLNFHHEIYDFADTILKARAIRALESVAAKYPVFRWARRASPRKLEDIFDDLALHSELSAYRLRVASLLLEGPGVFVEAEGARTAEYSSCGFNIWAESVARAEGVREQLFKLVGECYSPRQMFTLDWHFTDQRA